MTIKHRIGKIIIPLLPFNRRFFDVLRYEINAISLQVINRISPVYWWKVMKVRGLSNISLNIGSGGMGVEGWINIDLKKHKDTYLRVDVRKKMPFRNCSVKRIFAEHIVEHLDFKYDIPKVFSEFYRILLPGGVLRIIVPDAERFLRAYVSKDKELWRGLGWDLDNFPNDIYTPMHALNHIFQQSGEHLFAYDFDTLSFALQKAGFRKIFKSEYKKSIDNELCVDREQHKNYSLYVDAMKEL